MKHKIWHKYEAWLIYIQDTSLFGPSKFTIYMDAQMYGIRKTVITNSAVFVLDNSGSVHKWDSDDEFWSPNVLERDHNLSLSAGLRWIRSTGSLNWDSEIILIPLKSNVVDIVTDSTDARQHRNSLFVLSQSDRLAGERPKLIDFLKVLFYRKIT